MDRLDLALAVMERLSVDGPASTATLEKLFCGDTPNATSRATLYRTLKTLDDRGWIEECAAGWMLGAVPEQLLLRSLRAARDRATAAVARIDALVPTVPDLRHVSTALSLVTSSGATPDPNENEGEENSHAEKIG